MISFKLIRTAILSVSRGKNKLQNCTIYLVNFTLLGIKNWQRQRPASRSNKSGLGSLALHLLPVLPLTTGMKKKKEYFKRFCLSAASTQLLLPSC